MWHRPQNCDIIPLAKLQILKQNTEPEVQLREKETTTSTGTISKLKNRNQEIDGRPREEFSRDSLGSRGPPASSSGKPKLGTGFDKRNVEKLASPSGRHSFQHRLPTVEDFGIDQNKFYNESGTRSAVQGQGPPSANRSSQKYMDSSKSSDSSLSSYRMQESGSLRTGNVHNRMLQESLSSHNIPHVPIPGAGNSSDLTHSPSHSSGTPLMKKKLHYEAASHSKERSERDRERDRERDKSTKHQSFDYSESELMNFLF